MGARILGTSWIFKVVLVKALASVFCFDETHNGVHASSLGSGAGRANHHKVSVNMSSWRSSKSRGGMLCLCFNPGGRVPCLLNRRR